MKSLLLLQNEFSTFEENQIQASFSFLTTKEFVVFLSLIPLKFSFLTGFTIHQTTFEYFICILKAMIIDLKSLTDKKQAL